MDEIDSIDANQEQRKSKYHQCPRCGMFVFTETCPHCKKEEE